MINPVKDVGTTMIDIATTANPGTMISKEVDKATAMRELELKVEDLTTADSPF
jgi:hypothetical protein